MNQNAPCKLCGKAAKLLKKSHIIPDFMFKEVKDNDNVMMMFSSNDIDNPKKIQTAIFDRYILCEKCDNSLLGELERYVANILYMNQGREAIKVNNSINQDGLEVLNLTNVNTSKFRLFLLSIAWRFHHSQFKYYNSVSIKEHEPLLRDFLLNGKVDTNDSYRVGIIGIKADDGNPIRLALTPVLHQHNLTGVICMMIGSLIYFIELGQCKEFNAFKPMYLKSDGNMIIPILSGNNAESILTSLWNLSPTILLPTLYPKKIFQTKKWRYRN